MGVKMNRDETVLFVQIIVTNSRKFLAKLSMAQYGRELIKNVGQELGIIGQKAGCRRGLFAVLGQLPGPEQLLRREASLLHAAVQLPRPEESKIKIGSGKEAQEER